MAYDVKIVERAAAEIARRRQAAENTARRHREQLMREIPELARVQERIISSGMQVPTALGRGRTAFGSSGACGMRIWRHRRSAAGFWRHTATTNAILSRSIHAQSARIAAM